MSEQIIVEPEGAKTKEEVSVKIISTEDVIKFEGTIKSIKENICLLERKKLEVDAELDNLFQLQTQCDDQKKQYDLEIVELQKRLAQIEPEVDKVELVAGCDVPEELPIEP